MVELEDVDSLGTNVEGGNTPTAAVLNGGNLTNFVAFHAFHLVTIHSAFSAKQLRTLVAIIN